MTAAFRVSLVNWDNVGLLVVNDVKYMKLGCFVWNLSKEYMKLFEQYIAAQKTSLFLWGF